MIRLTLICLGFITLSLVLVSTDGSIQLEELGRGDVSLTAMGGQQGMFTINSPGQQNGGRHPF